MFERSCCWRAPGTARRFLLRLVSCVWLIAGSGLSVAAEALAEPPAVTRTSLDTAIRRGVDFLVSHQNPNGSWGGPTGTKDLNIYAPLPGAHQAFRAGASGLALAGVIAAAISSWLAITVLLRYVSKHSFGVFAVYRVVLAAVVFATIASRG